MAHRAHSDPGEEQEQTLFSTTLGRLLLTLLAIAAIVYAAALTISRTDGFREIVKEQISEKIGMPTAIESAAIDRRLQLVLEGISLSPRAGEDTPAGVEIAKATISFRPLSLLRVKAIRLQGPEFVFVTDRSANIRPRQMAPLSVAVGDILQSLADKPDRESSVRTERPEIRERLDAVLEKGLTIRMDSASMEWNLPDGSTIDRLVNFDLTATPFATRDGTAFYIYFAATPRRNPTDERGRIEAALIRMPDAGLHLIDKK